jgi:hypothetical protein
MTVLDIIKRSLRMLSVLATKEQPDAEEANDAFSVLNMMIDQWSNEKLMMYVMDSVLFPIVAGQATYSIGPTATDWVWPRPLRFEKAFVRFLNATIPTDYALEQIPNNRWQEIFQKTIQTNYPYFFRYLQDWPNGQIDIYPKPTLNLQFGALAWQQIPHFDSLVQVISLPPGYESALAYNLAIEIAPEYGLDPDQVMAAKAKETKLNIMRTNHETLLLSSDIALLTHGIYSIYADR